MTSSMCRCDAFTATFDRLRVLTSQHFLLEFDGLLLILSYDALHLITTPLLECAVDITKLRAPSEGEEALQLRCIVMCNVGTCHWILNNLEDADSMFRKVLDIEKDHKVAKESLQRVRVPPDVQHVTTACGIGSTVLSIICISWGSDGACVRKCVCACVCRWPLSVSRSKRRRTRTYRL